MQSALTFSSQEVLLRLFGPRDAFLRQVREAFRVKLIARGQEVRLEGAEHEVLACRRALEEMQHRVEHNESLSPDVVAEIIEAGRTGTGEQGSAPAAGRGPVGARAFRPKTPGQGLYVESILAHDIVFCIGPAGTGKTYLAVAVALDYLKRGDLKKIVLCRPAVEAGEHLGFLPGDLRSKVNPYLRPLYDALHDLMPPTTVKRYVENDLIEILPLAFVRGRTLDNSFIILDEAQNCTVDQMKTFLTRLGTSAKLVVTGDITQVDLPSDKPSGLVDVQDRLVGIQGIGFIRLEVRDIVRHRLVREIVTAYQREPASGADRTEELPADPTPEDQTHA